MSLQKEINKFQDSILMNKEGLKEKMDKILSMDCIANKTLPTDDEWLDIIRGVNDSYHQVCALKDMFRFKQPAYMLLLDIADYLVVIYSQVSPVLSGTLTLEYSEPIIGFLRTVRMMYVNDVYPEIDFWAGQVIKKQIAELEY